MNQEIPIAAAKVIAKKYGYTQVIIHAFDSETGTQHVTTYGKNLKECEQAAEGGNQIKRLCGWPEELCNAVPNKKTASMTIESIKDSDGWMELAHDLLFEKFKKDHPDLDEDDLSDSFYKEVVSKKFEYGEYADIEIIVDEDFNIVGGKIL